MSQALFLAFCRLNSFSLLYGKETKIKCYEINNFYCFLVLLTALHAKVSLSFSVMEAEDKKDIKLDGETEDDDKKSLLLPFGAYQVDNQEVCLISYDRQTAVTIRIVDINGKTLDSQHSALGAMQIVSFDISDYAIGVYSLVISTPEGTYLTGVFEVN